MDIKLEKIHPKEKRDYIANYAGKSIYVLEHQWIHRYKISDGSFQLIGSRLLPIGWSYALRFPDGSSDHVQVISRETNSTLKIDNLRFDILDFKPIQGGPQSLLEQWEKKLGMKLQWNGSVKIII